MRHSIGTDWRSRRFVLDQVFLDDLDLQLSRGNRPRGVLQELVRHEAFTRPWRCRLARWLLQLSRTRIWQLTAKL